MTLRGQSTTMGSLYSAAFCTLYLACHIMLPFSKFPKPVIGMKPNPNPPALPLDASHHINRQLLHTHSLAIIMAGLSRDTHPSSKLFDSLAEALSKMNEGEKKALMKKANGVFELVLKNKEGKTEAWVIDMKKNCEVMKVGEGPKPKADVTITMADEVFQQLADRKINGQKAFMGGKLKVKGNIQLATKLDVVLQSAGAKL